MAPTNNVTNAKGIFVALGALAYGRTPAQALGFYMAYLMLILELSLIVGVISGILTGSITPEAFYDFSNWLDNGVATMMIQAGWVLSILMCLGMGWLVLRYKGMHQNFSLIMLVILGGILAVFFGPFLGLIPIAYITTRESHL